MVVPVCNLSTWEAKAERFRVQGQPVIHKGILSHSNSRGRAAAGLAECWPSEHEVQSSALDHKNGNNDTCL